MNCFLVSALVCAAFGTSTPISADDLKASAQGEWQYMAIEAEGMKMPLGEMKFFLHIKGDDYKAVTGDTTIGAGKIKFDGSKSPAWMQLEVSEGEHSGETLIGIVKIEGDTMTACVAFPKKDRPKEFKTAENTGHLLVVFKRVKK